MAALMMALQLTDIKMCILFNTFIFLHIDVKGVLENAAVKVSLWKNVWVVGNVRRVLISDIFLTCAANTHHMQSLIPG